MTKDVALSADAALSMREAFLRPEGPRCAVRLFAFDHVGSTMDVARRLLSAKSDEALPVIDHPEAEWVAVLSMAQGSGRGRNNRSWSSPPRAGVYLTLSRCVTGTISFSAPLAAAVGARRAVLGILGDLVKIKWPNDLVVERDGAMRKLAGILVEGSSRGVTGSSSSSLEGELNVGIGMNLRKCDEFTAAGGVALDELLPFTVGYETVAAGLVKHIIDVVDRTLTEGFGPLREEWMSAAALLGRRCTLKQPDGEVHAEGELLGVDDDGAVLLRVDGRVRRFISGELSLRPTGETAAAGGAPR